MKVLALFVFLFHNVYATPVYEFFSKGSADYYRLNSENIVDFFHAKLKWPTNSYSVLFRLCRGQFASFGFEIAAGIKVNIFDIHLNLDTPKIQEVSFYCKNSKAVSEQIAKINKLKLTKEAYYYFRWDILKSELGIYAIQANERIEATKLEKEKFDKLLPVQLKNIQTQRVIVFGQLLDQQKKAEIHPMMDPSYPVRFDPLLNEFEFSVVEVSPFFFSQKTREVFEHFNKTFGIIPDRIAIINKITVAVIP
ncbi:MAG: hypothetical protein JNM24_19590 [Bdellovibrionaceae bacterium]|nr:hypothetical protein [Pseudobdellovibrionaceae bacterium]